MAAGPFDQEPRRVQRGARRQPRRRPARRHRTRPARAGDDVDADPAADDQHDEREGPAERPRPPVHGAGVQRAPPGVDESPDGLTRLASRSRDVGGRGPHAPLPHEGPRRDDPHLPAVLRPLHADGPRRQRHGADPQVQVRDEAERALGRDARLPAPHAVGPRRRRLRRRRREHPHQAARGVRHEAPRHREHPRHPPRDEGADGHPAALPPGRGPRGLRPDGQACARTRGRDRRAHAHQQRSADHAARRESRADGSRLGDARRSQPGRAVARGQHARRTSCSSCASASSTTRR